MFNIGDRIFYPIHGAGTIEGIEKKEVLGEEHEYLVLHLIIKELTLMVLKKNVEQSGLRKIVKDEKIKSVLHLLSTGQSDMSESWNKRYRDNMEKLKTGDIVEIAQVVRDLEIRDRKKGLSAGEKKMLVDSKMVLASEISLVKDIDIKAALSLISHSIA